MRRGRLILALLTLEVASLALLQVMQPAITSDPTVMRFEWSANWGEAGRDSAEGLTTADGGVYVAGTTAAQAFQRTHLFLLKYDPSGNLLWSRIASETSFGRGVAASQDAIYTVGAIIEEEGNRALLLRYSFSGELAWASRGAEDTVARGVAASPWGDIYISGYRRLSPVETRGILMSYKPDGNLNWSWEAPQGGLALAWAVAAGDGIYVSGSNRAGHATLVKLSRDGVVAWSRTKILGAESDGFAVTAGKEIIQAGFVRYGNGTSRALVVKYTPAGETNLVTTLGISATEDYAWAIASAGPFFYLGGHSASPASLDMLDASLLKINAEGRLVQARTWGGKGEDAAWGVAASDDSVYIAGETATLGVGGQAFLAKYTSPNKTTSLQGVALHGIPVAIFVALILAFIGSVRRGADGRLMLHGF